MQRTLKLSLAFVSCAIFFSGAVNLYPCAAGESAVSAPKKACHGKPLKQGDGKTDKKSEKPCCSLHCYNPATLQALVIMAPPLRTTIALRHEEHPPLSLTITPLRPPPRKI
ncbi:MAG: hypothetical protein U1F27_10975 [Turneriella sp.]